MVQPRAGNSAGLHPFYAFRQRARMSPVLNVHRIFTPLTVYPTAPAGEQNAPGWTACFAGGVVFVGFGLTVVRVGFGVGFRVVGATRGFGATVGVGVVVTVGVGVVVDTGAGVGNVVTTGMVGTVAAGTTATFRACTVAAGAGFWCGSSDPMPASPPNTTTGRPRVHANTTASSPRRFGGPGGNCRVAWSSGSGTFGAVTCYTMDVGWAGVDRPFVYRPGGFDHPVGLRAAVRSAPPNPTDVVHTDVEQGKRGAGSVRTVEPIIEGVLQTADGYWTVEVVKFGRADRWYRISHGATLVQERASLAGVQRILGDAFETLHPVAAIDGADGVA